jgi:ATP-binding protein involved in chromosome partitioning
VPSEAALPIGETMSDEPDVLKAALAALPELEGRLVMARVKEGTATVVVDATGLPAEERAQLERKVRAATIAIPGVSETRVAMTAEKRERTIVAIASGKGGVGKSTVSANLSVALARLGKRVGLVDADIYGPSQPRIMGQNGRPEMIDDQIVPLPAHGVRMLSIGQLIEPGTAVAWRGPMTASALSNLMEGDWGDCELLVVDMPPGTGDVQMTLTQKWKPAGAVIVSTPQDLALIDATRAIDMFRKMDVPVIGLIENMAGYACPHCGEVSDPFGAGGAEAAAKVMQIPFLGRIPLTLAIRRASDAGQPPAAGDGPDSAVFTEIAKALLGRLN